MTKFFRGAATAAFALALLGSPAADAQQDNVFAIVNGNPITANDVALAAEDLGSDLERIPEQLRPTVIVDILINQRLLAAQARREGVEDTDVFKSRLAYFTQQSLRDAYVEAVLIGRITEDEVKARYETEVAKLPETEEVRARHILVETEAQANALARIARGDIDFAVLAEANSTGPSASRGGDLDYFTRDRMVPEFAEAAFALDVGEVSDPVETQFGWHVIKLEDRRIQPPPPLESVHDSIKALVLRDLIKATTVELREAADIVFPHEEAADEAVPGEDGAGAAQ